LNQIFPKDIVDRNLNETNNSFSVQSSTIIFLSIAGFSDFSFKLGPEEFVNQLSYIFKGFNNECSNSQLLTNIKINEQSLMYASGLFSNEKKECHAEQAVNFSFDLFQILDGFNFQHNEKNFIQVGIDSDGPVIARIYGNERPSFEVIGDVVNGAEKLGSTCVSQVKIRFLKHQKFEFRFFQI
jgi:class 3 adenylate cyclase